MTDAVEIPGVEQQGRAAGKILLYAHPTCPMVPPVVTALKQGGAPFQYVNIHQDAAAAARVRQINQGYESVPTLVFLDGSTLTEPSPPQLATKLTALGYQLTPLTRVVMFVQAHWPWGVIGLGALWAILRAWGVL